MEEFRTTMNQGEEPSPYSAESVMSEAQAKAQAAQVQQIGTQLLLRAVTGSSNCSSPDEYNNILGLDKKSKKLTIIW